MARSSSAIVSSPAYAPPLLFRRPIQSGRRPQYRELANPRADAALQLPATASASEATTAATRSRATSYAMRSATARRGALWNGAGCTSMTNMVLSPETDHILFEQA